MARGDEFYVEDRPSLETSGHKGNICVTQETLFMYPIRSCGRQFQRIWAMGLFASVACQ